MAVGKTLVLNDDGLPDDINKMAGWGVIGSRPATGDVLAGSFYYDTTNSILYQEQNGSWVAVLQIRTLNPANETVQAGYYAATTLSAVDADLATANIKSGITIFGKPGSTDVRNSTDADGAVGDVRTGKTFYAGGGARKTGTYVPVVTLRDSAQNAKQSSANTWETKITASIPDTAKKVILSTGNTIMAGSGTFTQYYRGYYNGVQRYNGSHTGNFLTRRGYWAGDGVGSVADAYCQIKMDTYVDSYITGDILDVT